MSYLHEALGFPYSKYLKKSVDYVNMKKEGRKDKEGKEGRKKRKEERLNS